MRRLLRWRWGREMPVSSGEHPQPWSKRKRKKKKETYNTRDSLVVTGPTTSLALTGLSMGERTGSRVLRWLWSYVSIWVAMSSYNIQSRLSIPLCLRIWTVSLDTGQAQRTGEQVRLKSRIPPSPTPVPFMMRMGWVEALSKYQ
jgi:hypothetical protein